CPADDETPPPDAVIESWMHIESDRESDPDAREEIQAELVRVLGDVRDVVEDWQKMRAVALDMADSLAREQTPVPEAEVAEAQELLRWLASEHFTFIGYREYDLITDEQGEEHMRSVPGTGLRISRPDKLVSASFAQASTEVRAKVYERRLITLT